MPQKIQDLSILGFKYARFLADNAHADAFAEERKHYSYLMVYSYQKVNLDGFELFKIQQTPIIDLQQSLDDIFMNFRTLTRRGIRKSELMPELRFCVPDADTSSSFNFYKKIKSQDGVIPDIKREFQNCIFFNAYFKNELISSISFYDNGILLRCKHIVSARKELGLQSKIAAYAARRLVWEAAKYGKSRGYLKLDLGGINFTDPVKEGVAQFKSSFGGVIQDVFIYRYETRTFKALKKILNFFSKNIH